MNYWRFSGAQRTLERDISHTHTLYIHISPAKDLRPERHELLNQFSGENLSPENENETEPKPK